MDRIPFTINLYIMYLRIRHLILLGVLVVLSSCDKEDINLVLDTQGTSDFVNIKNLTSAQQAALDQILEMGYLQDSIKIGEAGFLVENDMIFSDHIEDYGLFNKEHLTTKQRYQGIYSSFTLIYYKIEMSSGGYTFDSDWLSSINAAILAINNLPNCRLMFREFQSGQGQPDITIRPLYTCDVRYDGNANLSSGGVPGRTVNLKTCYTNNRTSLAIHEIAHTVGLRHTNTTEDQFLPGSCQSDPYSLLNTRIGNNGFSTCDKQAFDILYPNASCLQISDWITSLSSSTVEVGNTLLIRWDRYKFRGSTIRLQLYVGQDNAHRIPGSSPTSQILNVVLPNNGSYSWIVPMMPLTNQSIDKGWQITPFRIRISDPTNSCYFDQEPLRIERNLQKPPDPRVDPPIFPGAGPG